MNADKRREGRIGQPERHSSPICVHPRSSAVPSRLPGSRGPLRCVSRTLQRCAIGIAALLSRGHRLGRRERGDRRGVVHPLRSLRARVCARRRPGNPLGQRRFPRQTRVAANRLRQAGQRRAGDAALGAGPRGGLPDPGFRRRPRVEDDPRTAGRPRRQGDARQPLGQGPLSPRAVPKARSARPVLDLGNRIRRQGGERGHCRGQPRGRRGPPARPIWPPGSGSAGWPPNTASRTSSSPCASPARTATGTPISATMPTDEKRLAYGNGGKLCRLNLATGRVTALLDDREGGVRDPVVHYDAGKILFSYRKGGTPYYHLYEMDLDGGEPAAVDRRPLRRHRALLPARRRHRLRLQPLQALGELLADAGGHAPPLRRRRPQHPRALGQRRARQHALAAARRPHALQRWEYVDRSQVDYHHLWTMNPDGTGQMVYYGNLHPGRGDDRRQADPRQRQGRGHLLARPRPARTRRRGHRASTPAAAPTQRSSAHSITPRGRLPRPVGVFGRRVPGGAAADRLVLLDGQGRAHEIYRVEQRGSGGRAGMPRAAADRAARRASR